jgi:hypothetical protein
MRKLYLFILSFSFYFVSCLYEPQTYYIFKVENQTNQKIIINYKTIDDEYEKSDTIQPLMTFEKKILEHSAFIDYKDSLVLKFFTKLSIQSSFKKMSKDPFNRKNWKEDLSLIKGHIFFRGGKCKYNFVVETNDF